MKTNCSTIFWIVLLCAGAAFTTDRASAATITWDAAQYATADTDVVTTGTLVTAIADITPGVGGGAPVTVNTVPFSDTATGTIDGLASTTWGTPNNAGMSAQYKDIIDSTFWLGGYSTSYPFTLDSLTPGQNYLVQMWATFIYGDGTAYPQYPETIDGVTVLCSTASGLGAGQFVTGTFTADATTQIVVFNGNVPGGNGTFFLSAYQVRAIPEPSVLILLGMGAICLFARLGRKYEK
jgi:hypothetical protein